MNISNQTITDKYVRLEILNTTYRLCSRVSHPGLHKGSTAPVESVYRKEHISIGTAIEAHLDRIRNYVIAGYVVNELPPESLPPSTLYCTVSGRIASSASATWA